MEALKVGFTGTRLGLTDAQYWALSQVMSLDLGDIAEWHHGDCVGADKSSHVMARRLGIPVVIHPPENPRLRAWCQMAAEYRPPLPYLVRNRAIVDETDVLVATPASAELAIASGTWATINYARELSRPLGLIGPDGIVTWERLEELP